MSTPARDLSPDPIVFPSSPPSAHDKRKNRRSENYGKSASPSKSVVINGPTERGQSPWRIRLTVESQQISNPQPSPRTKRKLARQERRQVAGLDVETGRPISHANTQSPRKKRRMLDRSESYEEPRNYELRGHSTPSETSRVHHRPMNSDRHDGRQYLGQEPQTNSGKLRWQRMPSVTYVTGGYADHDDYDGFDGYESAETDRAQGPPGAFPTGDSTMANEDFTMITGASLASLKANNSLMLAHEDHERTPLDEPPTFAPPVQSLYPDVSRLTPRAMQATEEVRRSVAARNTSVVRDYDKMSWQPTGRAAHIQNGIAPRPSVPASPTSILSHLVPPSSQARPRRHVIDDAQEPVSQRRKHQLTSKQPARYQVEQEPPEVLDFDDVWAEEASRSLQDDAQQVHEEVHGADFVPPIFSDEPQPPRRSKIPSTWRKSSGVNFSYADSPPSARRTQVQGTDFNAAYEADRSLVNAGGQQHRGVTHPRMDYEDDYSGEDDYEQIDDYDDSGGDNDINEQDEAEAEPEQEEQQVAREELAEQGGEDQEVEQPRSSSQPLDEEEDLELTNPDAAATQLQEVNHARKTARDLTSPQSDRPNIRTDPTVDDSGLLWHGDRPLWFSIPPKRPPRPKSENKVNLSEILRVDDTNAALSSPAARKLVTDIDLSHGGRVRPQQRSQAQASGERSSSVVDQADSSPLARGKLKSGRFGQDHHQQRPSSKQSTDQRLDHVTSMRAKPQLARGPGAPTERAKLSTTVAPERPQAASQPGEDAEDSEDDGDPSQSYQEYLNRHSPGKMRIDFNDSSLEKSKIDLHSYPKPSKPLFDRNPTTRPADAVEEGKQPPKAHGTRQLSHLQQQDLDEDTDAPGLLTRLTKSLWSAVVRPSGPIYVEPKPNSQQRPFQQAEEDEPIFPSALRARLRSRYGVLADHHPWTMTHMRTLHRMLNSASAAKTTSIVPSKLPLPSGLSKLVGKLQESATGEQFMFKYHHACAVNAFMQVMVPVSLVRAMERGEVEWLGDDISKSYRGLFAGRWGSDLCFKTIKTPEGLIDREWLVKCVGCVLGAIQESNERHAARGSFRGHE